MASWAPASGGKEGILRAGSKKLTVFTDRDVACKNKVEGYERGLQTDAKVDLAGYGRSLRRPLSPDASVGSMALCSVPSCSLVALSQSSFLTT